MEEVFLCSFIPGPDASMGVRAGARKMNEDGLVLPILDLTVDAAAFGNQNAFGITRSDCISPCT